MYFVCLNQLSGFTVKKRISQKWVKRCPIPENYSICILFYLLLLNLYYIIVTIRFRLIKDTDRHLLSKVYINYNDFLPEPSCSGKIKVSVRKINSAFGLSSGVAQQIPEHLGKRRKSAWLIYHWNNILGSPSIEFTGKEIKQQLKFHTNQRGGERPTTTYLL